RAANEFRVFAIGQEACRLVGLATRRQHPHRRTLGVVAGVGIGVDRDEQVGLVVAGDLETLRKLDEIVAVAGENGLHAGLAVDAGLKVTGDRQRDVFLQRAVWAVRALILAAVTGIDTDHHLA